MKNFKLLLILFLAFFSACSTGGDITSPEISRNCLSKSLELKDTNLRDSPGASHIYVEYDITNTSNEDYNPTGLKSKIVTIKCIVTTTDGKEYEDQTSILETISSGKTIADDAFFDYGAGKTYKSHRYEIYCEN